MATLDISEAIFSEEFIDEIIVIRREQNINDNGRPEPIKTVFSGVTAVVTSSNPNDLNRQDPNFEIASRTISVILEFRLRGETEGYFPDIVVWMGNNFIVKYIDLYPQFGNGFFQAVCTSMDREDEALEQIVNANSDFGDGDNSFMVTVCL